MNEATTYYIDKLRSLVQNEATKYYIIDIRIFPLIPVIFQWKEVSWERLYVSYYIDILRVARFFNKEKITYYIDILRGFSVKTKQQHIKLIYCESRSWEQRNDIDIAYYAFI
jgi:hypothetical protein